MRPIRPSGTSLASQSLMRQLYLETKARALRRLRLPYRAR